MGKKRRRRKPKDVRQDRRTRFTQENKDGREARAELSYIDSVLRRVGTTEDVNFEEFEQNINALRSLQGKEDLEISKPLDPELPKHPYDRYVDPYGDNPVTLHNVLRDAWETRPSDVAFISSMFGPRIVAMVQTSIFKYEESGKFTYKLPRELVEMFEQTSLKGVTPDVLQGLPHKSFYVDFDSFDGKIWGDMKTHWHEVSGAFLMEIEGAWVWVAWGAENERSEYFREDAMFSLGFLLNDWKNSGIDLESYIERRLNDVRTQITHSERGGLYESVMKDEKRAARQMETAWRVFRILINTVLYITTENPEIKRDIHSHERDKAKRALERISNPGSKKARLAKRELQKIPASRTHLIAPSLGEKIRKASRHSLEVDTKKKRHWVRGHWRQQPYWPEGREQDPVYKTIWIEPHLRGGM